MKRLQETFRPRDIAMLVSVFVLVPTLAIAQADPPIVLSHPPLLSEPAGTESANAQPQTRGAGGPTFEQQVVELVNQLRFDNGMLPPLKEVDLLDDSSETHSTNMATRDFFSHCDLDTLTSASDRMIAAGYMPNSAGENLAAGQGTPQSVVNAWEGSPGHLSNMLSTTFREFGTGYFNQAGDLGNVRVELTGDCTADDFNRGPFTHYWTQNFGRRNDVYPVVIERETFLVETRDVDLYLYGNPFAVEMRIRNENGTWTAWTPFTNDVAWQLSSGSGTKTVNVEIRNAAQVVRSASDTIELIDNSAEIFDDGFESGDAAAWN